MPRGARLFWDGPVFAESRGCDYRRADATVAQKYMYLQSVTCFAMQHIGEFSESPIKTKHQKPTGGNTVDGGKPQASFHGAACIVALSVLMNVSRGGRASASYVITRE